MQSLHLHNPNHLLELFAINLFKDLVENIIQGNISRG